MNRSAAIIPLPAGASNEIASGIEWGSAPEALVPKKAGQRFDPCRAAFPIDASSVTDSMLVRMSASLSAARRKGRVT